MHFGLSLANMGAIMTDGLTYVKLRLCLRSSLEGIPAKVMNIVLPYLAHLTIATQSSVASAMTIFIHIWAAHDLFIRCKEVDCHWLQDSRLNYIEQNADRFGVDADKLENVRVNMSKVSPMNDTLDLCARYANGKTLDDMVSHCCCFRLGCICSTSMHISCAELD